MIRRSFSCINDILLNKNKQTKNSGGNVPPYGAGRHLLGPVVQVTEVRVLKTTLISDAVELERHLTKK